MTLPIKPERSSLRINSNAPLCPAGGGVALVWSWLSVGEGKEGASWKKSYDKHRQHIKKQRYYFAYEGPFSQSYGFSSRHLLM